ncbi:hypothetical protein [Methylobacterium tardum]|uniref:hypothetical protein n=1 Tax=Methylobacterium tardum TaxID=374432 RepID=UPI003D328948
MPEEIESSAPRLAGGRRGSGASLFAGRAAFGSDGVGPSVGARSGASGVIALQGPGPAAPVDAVF